MEGYYLRGPIGTSPFLMLARVGRVPYFAHLTQQNGQDYVTFIRGYNPPSLLTFLALSRAGSILLSASIGNNNYKMGVQKYNNTLALAPAEDFSSFLPVTKEVANFGIFLAGVSYTLLIRESGTPVSILLQETIEDRTRIQTVESFYVLPKTIYYLGRIISFDEPPNVLDFELSWVRGDPVPPLYTNKEDSLQNIPYFYCKNTLCASNCKGGCSLSNEVCLFGEEENGFVCMTPPEIEVPIYERPWFIALSISLLFVFILSVILTIGVVLINKR